MGKEIMIKVGAWALTIGVLLALIAGFLPARFDTVIVAVLVLAGIAIGALNVSEKETSHFLMASVAIMIALFTAGRAIESSVSALGFIGAYLWNVLQNVNLLVFPATIVVALKSIYDLAHA